MLQPAKAFLFLLVAGAALGVPGVGQTSEETISPPTPPASRPAQPKRGTSHVTVKNVAAIHDQQGTGIEITSTTAVVPSITKLDGPPRLLIDLPGAVNRVSRSRILPVQGGEIKTIAITQLQQNPPITRISVDLTEARTYSWEAANDKLVVYLRSPETPPGPEKTESAKADVPASSITVPVFTKSVEPAITTASIGGGVGLVLAGNPVGRGSTVSAGEETTILNLSRGGTIRVCPGTNVSVTTSQNGRELMLAMSTGSLEAHYSLASSQDSIFTPDFRIALPGPGDFAYAFSADAKGNTCVRTLPGNTASAVVSELMGDGTYQVKPNEEVVFRNGQLANADHSAPLDCGCPNVKAPVVRAEAAQQSITPEQVSVAGTPENSPGDIAPGNMDIIPPVASLVDLVPNKTGAREPVLPAKAETQVAADAKPLHIQIEAPLVFRGDQPPAAPTNEAAKLPAVSPARSALLSTSGKEQSAQPPKEQNKARGFLGKVRRFFSSLFG